MNIFNEEILGMDLQKCNRCKNLLNNVTRLKIFYSQVCLIRLCESCFKASFPSENNLFDCNFCKIRHNSSIFADRTREEIFYEYDLKARKTIMAL